MRAFDPFTSPLSCAGSQELNQRKLGHRKQGRSEEENKDNKIIKRCDSPLPPRRKHLVVVGAPPRAYSELIVYMCTSDSCAIF